MINNTDNYVTAWKAWYNDGSSSEIQEYNSLEHNLVDLPADGFQAMRLWYSDGTGRFISGNDYYFFASHPSGTIYGQTNDSYDSIMARYAEVSIKQGKHVPEGMMHDIINIMNNAIKPM